MKNLKINNEKFKRLMSFGLACVLAGSFTGCSSKNAEKEEGDKIVANNIIYEVKDLDLMDTKTDAIIDDKEDVVSVVVDGVFDNEFSFYDIMYNENVDFVVVKDKDKDKLIDPEILEVFDSTTNESLNPDYYIKSAENKFIPVDGTKCVESNSTQETVNEEEYEELTDEKFYALADEVYKKYEKIGLDVSKEEVIDFVMMVNIDRLAKDNNNLIETIIGDRNTDLVVLNMMDVYSAIKTKNDNNYCAKGLGFDSLILVNDTVFDKETKEKVVKFEERVEEIFNAKDNKEQFNTLLNTLLMEVLTATEEEFNMENGAGYSCMEVLIYFIRSNFTNSLNKANGELIKYFCNYATEFGTDYYYNSRSSAYYSGIYYLLTENLGCVKTRTK